MPNQYEEASRLRKVIALADFLADQGCTAELAAVMDQEQWRVIAKHAGVYAPSAETQRLVILRLRSRSADRREPDYQIQGKEW